MRLIGTSMFAAIVFTAPIASALTLTLNGTGVSAVGTSATALDANWDFVTSRERQYPTTLPYSTTSESVQGENVSQASFSLTHSGFTSSLSHSRGAMLESGTSTVFAAYFSPDEDVDYEISAFYSAIDPDPSRVTMWAYLGDETDSIDLFYNIQSSEHTPNEHFSLGLIEADTENLLEGSLTGQLVAGHGYRFLFGASTLNLGYGIASSMTASGNVSIQFTPVPEPSTAVLLGIGLFGLGARHRFH